MSNALDFYAEQVDLDKQSDDWLLQQRKAALETLKQRGFPTRHDEAWKYTRVDNFLAHRFSPPSKTDDSTPLTFDTLYASGASIQNGVVTQDSTLDLLREVGVIIEPLMKAIDLYPEKIKPYLTAILPDEHGFQALNTAAWNMGFFIYVPEKVVLAAPILLSHWQSIANQAMHIRHLIVLDAESEATIVEAFHGADACSYFTNAVTEIQLHAAAKLSHYKLQSEGDRAYHCSELAVSQLQGSELASHVFNFGGQWSRTDVASFLQEKDSVCLLNGLYLPINKQHMDNHTAIYHAAPDCSSIQDYKGILMDESRAVFNGRVVVEEGASHTVAQQKNKNVLLSARAEIDTKPQLEIFNDDVKCSHGATVGQLDEEILFYMATRGIGREEALPYLIQAFIADNMTLIADISMSTWITGLINERLG